MQAQSDSAVQVVPDCDPAQATCNTYEFGGDWVVDPNTSQSGPGTGFFAVTNQVLADTTFSYFESPWVQNHIPDNESLVGVITRRDIFEVYNREVLHHEDMGINLVTGEARMHDCVELPETYKVQLLTPPESWLGRSLSDLALRRRFAVSVLAVKRRTAVGGFANEMPEPDRALTERDRLIVVGRVEDLERLLREMNPRAFACEPPRE